jgi:methylated-DNA-[protein]-cysteine S-methyltransferase
VLTPTYESPIGTLTLAADTKGLRHIVFPSGSRAFKAPDDWETRPRAFVQVFSELNEYFAGTRQKFDVKLAPAGTDFQRSVWLALLSIGYAETCSYGQIAENIGKPKASRAVGIPIIVPCHRVIGSSGNLTGFGGGLETKAWLLAHERGEGQLFGFTNP